MIIVIKIITLILIMIEDAIIVNRAWFYNINAKKLLTPTIDLFSAFNKQKWHKSKTTKVAFKGSVINNTIEAISSSFKSDMDEFSTDTKIAELEIGGYPVEPHITSLQREIDLSRFSKHNNIRTIFSFFYICLGFLSGAVTASSIATFLLIIKMFVTDKEIITEGIKIATPISMSFKMICLFKGLVTDYFSFQSVERHITMSANSSVLRVIIILLYLIRKLIG